MLVPGLFVTLVVAVVSLPLVVPAPAPHAEEIQTPAVATEVLIAGPTHPPATPQPVLLSTSVSGLLTRHLEAEATATGRVQAWHARIVDVAVGLQTAVIRTDLTDASGDLAAAEAIADAVHRFPRSRLGRGIPRLDVQVFGSGGRLLVERSGHDLALESRGR